MAIVKRQPGEAKAAAQAGAVIGAGQRATEERARAERAERQKEQIAAQREQRKAAMKWELKKMQMRSEQDFQQELADRQWDFEKYNRAKAWEIEKMELTSQLDFEKEEKKRSQRMEEGEIGLKQIEKAIESGQISGDEPRIVERREYYTDKAAGVTAPLQGLYNIPQEKEEKEPTFYQKKAAAEYLEKTKQNWWEKFRGKEFPPEEAQVRAEAEELLFPTGTISSIEPIYQENKRTGQKRVSYDGGKTWQLL